LYDTIQQTAHLGNYLKIIPLTGAIFISFNNVHRITCVIVAEAVVSRIFLINIATMNYLTLMQYILFFGFTFSIILAIVQIIREKPELANYLNSTIFLCNGIIQLGILLIALDIPEKHPLSIFSFITSIFTIGPLLYIYTYTLLNPFTSKEGFPNRLKAHLVPGLLVLVCEVIFQLQPEDYKKSIIDLTLNGTEWTGITYLCLAGSIHVSLYFVYMLFHGLSVRNIKSLQLPLRILYSVYFACMLAVLMISFGFFGKNYNILYAGGAIIPVINTIIFLANNRYPRFFRAIESEIKKKKYEKSLLYGIDTKLLSEQLNELMTEKCIYKEFDITLEKLSGMLLITPHQLSEMLNEKLKTNFWQYINSFRIEEAKKLLVNNPDQSIITICYNVGFGSKSTFNDIFKKFTGENPREYRNRHAK
jgi:AraC-like DNA-binding protein